VRVSSDTTVTVYLEARDIEVHDGHRPWGFVQVDGERMPLGVFEIQLAESIPPGSSGTGVLVFMTTEPTRSMLHTGSTIEIVEGPHALAAATVLTTSWGADAE
jgi:hypothetical protein